MVLPNSHYCVDMHRDCRCKQRFASQSFWQYCFPFTASEVKLSLLSRPFTMSLLAASFPLGVKCLTPAPRRLPMSASSLLPALCFSKPSFRFHRPSCLGRDFCKRLLGYFIIPFKCLLNFPLLWCLQGSCRQLAWWCVMTTANMVPQFPCAPLSASICSLSSCTRGMLMRLSLLLRGWQENWSNVRGATKDTSSRQLGVDRPRLVAGRSTALALAPGRRRSSAAVLPTGGCTRGSCPTVSIPLWTLLSSSFKNLTCRRQSSEV